MGCPQILYQLVSKKLHGAELEELQSTLYIFPEKGMLVIWYVDEMIVFGKNK